jgi:hypothetical protein
MIFHGNNSMKNKPMNEVTNKISWENGKRKNDPSIEKCVPWKN